MTVSVKVAHVGHKHVSMVLLSYCFHNAFGCTISGSCKICFSQPPRPGRLYGPPSLLSDGTLRFLSTGVKRTRREADQSLPPSADAQNEWFYKSNSTPPHARIELFSHFQRKLVNLRNWPEPQEKHSTSQLQRLTY